MVTTLALAKLENTQTHTKTTTHIIGTCLLRLLGKIWKISPRQKNLKKEDSKLKQKAIREKKRKTGEVREIQDLTASYWKRYSRKTAATAQFEQFEIYIQFIFI